MKLIGIECASPRATACHQGRSLRRLRRILDSTHAPPPDSPPSGAIAAPMLHDDKGDTYLIVPGPHEPLLIPWVSGSHDDDDGPRSMMINLIDSSVAGSSRPSAARASSGGISSSEIRRNILDILDEAGILEAIRASGNTASSQAATNGVANAAPQGGSANDNDSNGGAQHMLDGLPEAASAGLAQAVARALGELNFGVGSLASGLVATASNLLTSASESIIMGKVGIGPESSTAKIALATVGPRIAKELALGKIMPTFREGPYESPAVRQGDMDAAGNAVTVGFPSVEIESCAAAREGDVATGGYPQGTVCLFGARNVLIGNACAARMDDPSTYGTTVVMGKPFNIPGSYATRTFIGGITNNPKPDVPEDLREAAKARMKELKGDAASNEDLKEYQAKPSLGNPRPDGQESGFWFEPDEGEWRFWDGRGWSSTASEYAALPDLPNLGVQDFFEGIGFELGSPWFPGAGTGSTWWVPDTIFGHDMSAYFTSHDLQFDPTHMDLGAVLDAEWNAFMSGLEDIYDIILLPVHIIYSLSTTIAALLQWQDATFTRLDK